MSAKRIVKALQEAIPPVIVQLVLYVVAIRILTDDSTPEGLSWEVQRHLTHFPLATELIEDISSGLCGDTHAPIALHDEELAHPVLVLRKGNVRVDEPKPCVLAINLEEVRP
jgi:hypothetical protein